MSEMSHMRCQWRVFRFHDGGWGIEAIGHNYTLTCLARSGEMLPEDPSGERTLQAICDEHNAALERLNAEWKVDANGNAKTMTSKTETKADTAGESVFAYTKEVITVYTVLTQDKLRPDGLHNIEVSGVPGGCMNGVKVGDRVEINILPGSGNPALKTVTKCIPVTSPESQLADNAKPEATGWLCPRCGKSLAPWVRECGCGGWVTPCVPYVPPVWPVAPPYYYPYPLFPTYPDVTCKDNITYTTTTR